MTINEAIQQFEKIKAATNSKSLCKTCQKFINTLSSLEELSLNSMEKEILVLELNQLDFSRFNKASAMRKSYRLFLQNLQQKLSLTPKKHYASTFGAIGMNLGILAGIVLLGNLGTSLGIAIGLALGMALGHIYGKSLDQKAEAAEKVLS